MDNRKRQIIGHEDGTRACGHADKFKILKGEPAEWTANRRKKWNASRCQACHQADLERVAREAEERRLRDRGQRFAKGRLPHGSEYRALYSADTESWHGWLTVDKQTFEGKAAMLYDLVGTDDKKNLPIVSGLRKLLAVLDDKYRETLPAASPDCGCIMCLRERDKPGEVPAERQRMVVCQVCGNKRCPHATDHRLACTNSNDPGQPGSVYATEAEAK